MTVPPALSARLASFSQLLKIFDEVRQPLSTASPGEPSKDLKRCRAGEISVEEYLRRRIEISLARLAPHLGPEELSYVRHACFEYIRDDFVHTGMFRGIAAHLRKTNKSGQLRKGHPPRGGALMNQNENTAKKSDTTLGSEDLQALKRGEITVDEYLERRLERQIESINVGRVLTDEERDKLRAVIRENFLRSPFFRHYTDAMMGGADKDPSRPTR